MTEPSIILTKDELEALTGFKIATMQLTVLHRRGSVRAFIGRNGLVLERAHYEAVARGSSGVYQPSRPAKQARLDHLKG